jgi:hypothetical protein
MIRLFILARQHQGEDTNWFEDHQDFLTKEKKLRKKRELFEEYVRELKALGYSQPPDPSIALESKRSRPLPHVRKSVCALYHSLSRSLTCAVNVDPDESDDEDQHQVRLCLYVDGFHKVEMDNVAFELTVSTHHNGHTACPLPHSLPATYSSPATPDWYREFLFRARAHVAAGSSPSLALPLKLDDASETQKMNWFWGGWSILGREARPGMNHCSQSFDAH